jgi:MoaA/NifB/PqqE/SkfB family radical SAM enzyme
MRRSGINTYLTTNLSLPLKDERIMELIDSGISMIIVAVDGVSDETFGQQRVGGKWDLVKDNIRRLGEYKARSGRRWPHLVLQYLTFDFNAHETVAARKFAADAGFDDVHFIRGDTTPWTERRRLRLGVEQKRARLLPHCAWPYFSMVVSSSGQVSPCCISRMDDYHRRSTVPRSMGNILEERISSIYLNSAYRSARRLSANPTRHSKEAPGHFCEGCGDLAVK